MLVHSKSAGCIYFTLALHALAQWAGGDIIRLKNGIELHCEILECSEEEGLEVKRLDNGGVFHLKWEHILEADADAIRQARGFTDETALPVFIRCTRIVLRNGSFEDGILIRSDRPGYVGLRRLGRLYHFRRSAISEIQSVDLEAYQVYTLEELHLQQLRRKLPITARDHFNLGVYLESVTHYEKALEMFERARVLDPAFKPEVIARKIKIIESRIRHGEASRLMDEIKRMVYRRKFELALERLDAFEEKYPGSALKGYEEQLRSYTLAKRREYHQRKILGDYFIYMEREARKVAGDRKITLKEAVDFATDELGPAIRRKLAEDVYGISVEEVEALWAGRSGGTHRTYSYGTGTYILGEERALRRLTNQTVAEEAPIEGVAPKTMDEKLRARLESIRIEHERNRKNRRDTFEICMQNKRRDPEEWWRTESVDNRKRFLIAFYAEESGDMKILGVRFKECPHCCGKGVILRLSTTDIRNLVFPCEMCHTLGVERIVTFK